MERKTYKSAIKNILFTQHKYRDPDYSAARLAQDLGIDPRVLSGILTYELGKSYATLVNEQRIKMAKRLFADKSNRHLLVDDVAVMVGFRNRQSFFVAFRKYTGTTPNNWRTRPNAGGVKKSKRK